MPNGPIKTIGDSNVSVQLHTDVVVEINVPCTAKPLKPFPVPPKPPSGGIFIFTGLLAVNPLQTHLLSTALSRDARTGTGVVWKAVLEGSHVSCTIPG
jgi:hypothetical protein